MLSFKLIELTIWQLQGLIRQRKMEVLVEFFFFLIFVFYFLSFWNFFLLFHWISLSFVLLHSFILIMFSIIVKVVWRIVKEWGEVKFYSWKKSSQKDISQLRRELIFHKFCLNTFKRIYFLIEHLMTRTNVMLCEIWNHLHNLKNVKNTHGGVLFLVKLKAKSFQLY